jgi:hypothetical protein
MIRRLATFALVFGMAISSYVCLCSHEKPTQVSEASHSCHQSSEETPSSNKSHPSNDCCCMDKHNVGETQEAFVSNYVYAFGTELIVPITFESFRPVIVTFKLDRNFHPPSTKLPIYFSKHSFLI